eukprot:1143600-Pelagomonas_calceolata.AAC.3
MAAQVHHNARMACMPAWNVLEPGGISCSPLDFHCMQFQLGAIKDLITMDAAPAPPTYGTQKEHDIALM